jgi:hypothetical protein
MRAIVSEGEFADAEVLRREGTNIRVELETGEEAVVPLLSLLGDTDVDKAHRFADLTRGQPMRVLIRNIYEGRRFERRIVAKEVRAPEAREASPPARAVVAAGRRR